MAAPLFVKAFSSLFLGFGKSAQAAKSFSQAGALAAGQFSKGISSNLVKGVNAAQLGKNIGDQLNHGLVNAFKDAAYRRSTEMWGRTSAAMLYGGTGARAAAAGNALKTYGGSAETYSQTMMGLQSRLTGLKYGNTGWLVEAMQKSGGLLDIFGSGELGFATGEELIRNLAKIKDQIPVGQFQAVANALGLTADIQKSILDNNLDFLNKANYLTDEQEKKLTELGKSQLETAKVWEKVSQEWGANTAKYWGWWENTKQGIGNVALWAMGKDPNAMPGGDDAKSMEDRISTMITTPEKARDYAGFAESNREEIYKYLMSKGAIDASGTIHDPEIVRRALMPFIANSNDVTLGASELARLRVYARIGEVRDKGNISEEDTTLARGWKTKSDSAIFQSGVLGLTTAFNNEHKKKLAEAEHSILAYQGGARDIQDPDMPRDIERVFPEYSKENWNTLSTLDKWSAVKRFEELQVRQSGRAIDAQTESLQHAREGRKADFINYDEFEHTSTFDRNGLRKENRYYTEDPRDQWQSLYHAVPVIPPTGVSPDQYGQRVQQPIVIEDKRVIEDHTTYVAKPQEVIEAKKQSGEVYDEWFMNKSPVIQELMFQSTLNASGGY